MYVAKFPTALCRLDKTPTQDILKFRQATWDTPLAGPHYWKSWSAIQANWSASLLCSTPQAAHFVKFLRDQSLLRGWGGLVQIGGGY